MSLSKHKDTALFIASPSKLAAQSIEAMAPTSTCVAPANLGKQQRIPVEAQQNKCCGRVPSCKEGRFNVPKEPTQRSLGTKYGRAGHNSS